MIDRYSHVIVDECGDPGLKFGKGSSQTFSVTAVLFKDVSASKECSDCITKLRQTLKLPHYKEFHFSKDNNHIRSNFLSVVSEHDFVISSFILNKPLLTSEGFKVKESLYKFTVQKTFKNIESILHDAVVIFDQCGGREFNKQLKNYLRRHAKEWGSDDGRRRIKDVKSEKSQNNNLIQMADMIGGAISRSFSERDNKHVFRNIIRNREYRVNLWPKAEKPASLSPSLEGTHTLR